MEYITGFDYAACAILVVAIFTGVIRKVHRAASGRFFILLCAFTIVTAVFDVIATMPSIGYIPMWVVTGLYLFFRSCTPLVYAVYLISLTDTMQNVRKSWKMSLLLVAPFTINFCCMATNPIHHLFFDIASDLSYTRGPLMAVQYGMTVLYILVGIFYVTKYRHYFSMAKLVTIHSFYAATVVSIIIQYFYPNILIELFVNSGSLLFYLIMLHKPEDIFDFRTGAQNENSFLLNMRRDIDLKKKTYVILGHLYNYRSLLTLYDTETTSELLKSIGKRFMTIAKGFGINATYYTSERGDFNVIFEDKKRTPALKFAAAVEDFLQSDFSDGSGRFRGVAKTVIIHQPDDFENYEAFVYFAAHYWQFSQFKENVVNVSRFRGSLTFQALMQINSILSEAIKERKFEMYYQPLYSIKENRFVAAEALVRLKDERFGFIPPDLMIPFAERSGQITAITDIIIEKVMDFIASYDFKRLGLSSVEINLSIADCLDRTLIERIDRMAHERNISPTLLNFEATETYTTEQRDEVKDFLNDLTSRGYRLSVDDFGTGYSNFARLVDLPFNMIKMDRSMVLKCQEEKMKKIIPSIVSVGKTLGESLVIEGVETKEQLEIFKNYGVDYVQGYYFSKPLPVDEFVRFVDDWNKKS